MKKIFSQETDPTFTASIEDCKNHKLIENRLFNKPSNNEKPIDILSEKPKYSDIDFPKCRTIQDTGTLKSSFVNIFTMPEGERLDKMCLHGKLLNKKNSCLSIMKFLITGTLHGIELMNMSGTYLKHSNLYPDNIYYNYRKDIEKIFLDNMLYDSNKYDNPDAQPFKSDFNLLADTLIKLVTGKEDLVVNYPLKDTFDLYHQIRTYFYKNHIPIRLNSSFTGIGSMKEGDGKCITRTEFDYKLQKSLFNFIYRLKCKDTVKNEQFESIKISLEHPYLKKTTCESNKDSETWDSLPADY